MVVALEKVPSRVSLTTISDGASGTVMAMAGEGHRRGVAAKTGVACSGNLVGQHTDWHLGSKRGSGAENCGGRAEI